MWASGPDRPAAAGSNEYMANSKRSLLIGGLGAIALSATFSVRAQDSNTIIGPPQLKDFQLQGNRQVTQPAPSPAPAAPAPAPVQPDTGAQAPPTSTQRAATAPARREAPSQTAALPSPPSAESLEAIDRATAEAPAPAAAPVAATPQPEAPAAAPAATATNWWYYAVPGAALALVGIVLVGRRRRRPAELFVEAEPEPATVPAVAPKPRPDPIPRPWLELALKAERASFTDSEAELMFELEISNKGGSPAKNLRIDVKMFNGGVDQQDTEIGTFFKTAGRESTKLNLPIVEAGITGVIQGRVTMAREEMRALRLDERLLFIPVVAVNALYDWGEGRTGQTSKSYLIGRELQEQNEKMGAFRVDQGPRIWRTVAQRPHKLTKRV